MPNISVKGHFVQKLLPDTQTRTRTVLIALPGPLKWLRDVSAHLQCICGLLWLSICKDRRPVLQYKGQFVAVMSCMTVSPYTATTDAHRASGTSARQTAWSWTPLYLLAPVKSYTSVTLITGCSVGGDWITYADESTRHLGAGAASNIYACPTCLASRGEAPATVANFRLRRYHSSHRPDRQST